MSLKVVIACLCLAINFQNSLIMLLGKDLTNFGSCIQHKDADSAKPGTENSSTYMFDVPRYEKMAFAAALSGNSVDPSDLSSLRTTLADNQSVQSSIKIGRASCRERV